MNSFHKQEPEYVYHNMNFESSEVRGYILSIIDKAWNDEKGKSGRT